MKRIGRDLDKLVERATQFKGVRRVDLRPGDLILITTRNSVYAIRVLDDASYLVSGGWFDRKGLSPMRTTIAGCTWGGSAIKADLIAARGMGLEFGNRVVTSPIEKVWVFRYGALN